MIDWYIYVFAAAAAAAADNNNNNNNTVYTRLINIKEIGLP